MFPKTPFFVISACAQAHSTIAQAHSIIARPSLDHRSTMDEADDHWMESRIAVNMEAWENLGFVHFRNNAAANGAHLTYWDAWEQYWLHLVGGLISVNAEMQWAMATEPELEDPINRDLYWTNAMQDEVPRNWKGLLRLGMMNRFFFRTETNKRFVMEMVFAVFKVKLNNKWKVQYWADFIIYHTLLKRSLVALKLENEVPIIASFLISRRELAFFREYINKPTSHADIVTFLTMKYGTIVL